MKKLILLALVFVICGCKQPTDNINAPVGGSTLTTAFQTIIIDSCEYIVGSQKVAHKGNCKFCQKRLENTIDSIIKNNK